MDKSTASHPFCKRKDLAHRKEVLGTWILRLLSYSIVAATLLIFAKVSYDGVLALTTPEAPFVNLEMFTKSPETLHQFTTDAGTTHSLSASEYRQWKDSHPEITILQEKTHSYSAGGILGPLVGTGLLIIIAMLVALSIGIATAIFLSEYSRKGPVLNGVRLAIMNLAGVPSIVYGLFGYAFFCLFPLFPVITRTPSENSLGHIQITQDAVLSFQGWGNSLLAGGFTLALMVVPVIITACEESLRAVPQGFREASLALGANRWQMIRTAVLPYALPGLLTASVLGITRVAGETAPIMLTAAVADKDHLPWTAAHMDADGGSWVLQVGLFFQQQVQALPYHIYTVAAKIPQDGSAQPMQNAAVFIFLLLVCGFALLSVYLRARIRNKLHW